MHITSFILLNGVTSLAHCSFVQYAFSEWQSLHVWSVGTARPGGACDAQVFIAYSNDSWTGLLMMDGLCLGRDVRCIGRDVLCIGRDYSRWTDSVMLYVSWFT